MTKMNGPLSEQEKNLPRHDHLSRCGNYGKRSALIGLDLCFVPILLLLLYRIVVQPYQMSADCSFFLYGSRLLLNGGGRLYLDWFDINPPLIFYLNLVPVAMAQVLSTSIIPTFLVVVYLLVAWSTFSIRKSLLDAPFNLAPSEVGLLLSFWTLFNLFVLHQNDFGQRDHLLIVLFAPYFVVRWLRWHGIGVGSARAVILGAAAGLGVYLKPAFLVLPIAVELYWLATSRLKVRPLYGPEIIAVILTGFVYLLHFVFLPTDIRNYFFDFILPLTAEVYPQHVTTPLLHVLNHKLLFVTVILGVLPFITPHRKDGPLWSLARSSGILVAACLVVYLIHRKGFSYHLDPLLGAASLIPGIVFAEFKWIGFFDLRNFGCLTESMRKIVAALVIAVTLIMTTFIIRGSVETKPVFDPNVPFNKAVTRYSRTGDNVLVLSPEVLTGFPYLLQLNRHQATRFSGALFMLPVLDHLKSESHSSRPRAGQYEQTILNGLAADVRKFHPRIILIDDFQWQPSKIAFKMSDYLSRIGFVSGPMKNYQFVGRMNTLSIYKARENR